MKKVVFDTSADQDLASILKYLLEETQRISIAEKLVDLIYDKASTLKEFPELYPVYTPTQDMKHTYRFYPVLNYLVFYYVEYDFVHISRIIHTKRDISKHLK